MSFSDYLETKTLNDYFVTPTVYIALFTTDPTDADIGTEVSGGGYARQEISFGAPSDDGSDNMEITNDAEVRFPIALGSWGTVTHAGIYDAITGGNLLDHTTLDTSREIQENDQFVFEVGGYTVKIG